MPFSGREQRRSEDASARIAALFSSNSGPPVVVSEARRLGAPSATRTKPRPVLNSFSFVAAKHAALKHAKTQRQRQIYLDPASTSHRSSSVSVSA